MKNNRLFWTLFISFEILFLVPVWLHEFLPFIDYPLHLGTAHVFHRLQTATTLYNQHFGCVLFPRSRIVHIFLLHFLSYTVPTEIAGKIIVSAYVLLFPLSVLSFIRSLDGDRYASLLSFPFIYNYNVLSGSLSFFFGIPFFFFSLALIERWSFDHVRKYGAWIAVLFVLVFFIHAWVYVLLLGSFFVILLFASGGDVRVIAKKGWPAIPSVIAALPWIWANIAGRGPEIAVNIGSLMHRYRPRWGRLHVFPDNLAFNLPFDDIIIAAVFVVIASLVISGGKRRECLAGRKVLPLYVLTGAALAGYLVVPMHIRSVAFFNVYQRFALFIMLGLIAIAARVPIKKKAVYALVTSLIVLLAFLDLMRGFSGFNRLSAPVRSLLAQAGRGKKMVEVYYRQTFRTPVRYKAFFHFSSYYLMDRDGLAGFMFSDFDEWQTVKLKQDYRSRKVSTEKSSQDIFPWGLEEFDYFLVCGFPPDEDAHYYRELDLVGRAGVWALYRKGPS
jgi:hypothetical protein